MGHTLQPGAGIPKAVNKTFRIGAVTAEDGNSWHTDIFAKSVQIEMIRANVAATL